MATDLERRLSDVLHATTPEPPTAYRFVPPADPRQLRPIELLEPTRTPGVRRHRWTPLLAAAAVLVLGAALAVAAVLRHGEHGSPAATTGSPVRRGIATPARCVDDHVTLSHADAGRSGSALTEVLTVTNTGPTACTLAPLPVLSLVSGPTEGAPPARTVLATGAVPADGRLPRDTALAYTVRLRIISSCPRSAAVPASLAVDMGDGFAYRFAVTGAGCGVGGVESVSVAHVRPR